MRPLAMPERKSPHDARRARSFRLLFAVLTAILILFALWCVFLLLRVHRLRADLDRHLRWSEEIRGLRNALEQVRAEDQAAPDAPVVDALLDAARSEGDRDLLLAARKLELALEPLHDPATASTARFPATGATTDALAAIGPVMKNLERRMAQLNAALGPYWTSLNVLVVAALLLAASNLALLRLVHHRRLALEDANAIAMRSASHDPLTGLWNREAILKILREELVRGTRLTVPVGVVLADLDSFRELNVLHGHDQGDDILRQVAERMRSLVRPYDTMGRYGGDAFLIVLPACDDTATDLVARRLDQAVNAREMEYAYGRLQVRITLASASVIEVPQEVGVDWLIKNLRDGIGRARQEGVTWVAVRSEETKESGPSPA